jgi:hypothetical protein
VVCRLLVVPAPPRGAPPRGSVAASLLGRLRTLAGEALGPDARVVAVTAGGAIAFGWDAEGPRAPEAMGLEASAWAVANVAAVLGPRLPVGQWLARSESLLLARDPVRSELYAAVVHAPLADPTGAARLLARLTSGQGAPPEAWPAHAAVVDWPPQAETRSRAGEWSRARPAGVPSAAVHAALAELLDDHSALPSSPEGLAGNLAARRGRSAVPWLLNLLANELEYESGGVRLRSLPPEVHLSLTDACNIECGFCTYTHEHALGGAVALDDIEGLGFLGSLHTLRLSSGLGEPTMVRDLPRIVRHLQRTHPHLRLNFFTNGLALGRQELVDALVGRVTWINVSLNAATRESWRDICGTDGFDRLCGSVAALRDAKRAAGSVHPLLYGSAVVTRRVVGELPRLPALCRELGIDRLTLIPFFALGFEHLGKLGAEDALEACRPEYDGVYDAILAEGERHGVSIELPLPAPRRQADFGLERRGFHDFAGIGQEEPLGLGRLVKGLFQPEGSNPLCHWLWRLALIGRVDRTHLRRGRSTHFLYPCLGPLVTVDFSDRTAFHFSGPGGLAEAWNHPVFTFLRAAQKRHGDSRVCDLCRAGDTREPARFQAISEALGQWSPAAPQVMGGISR